MTRTACRLAQGIHGRGERAYEAAGLDVRATEKGYEELGIDQKAEAHKGKDATALEKKGEKTRVESHNRKVGFDNVMRPYDRALDNAPEQWAFSLRRQKKAGIRNSPNGSFSGRGNGSAGCGAKAAEQRHAAARYPVASLYRNGTPGGATRGPAKSDVARAGRKTHSQEPKRGR